MTDPIHDPAAHDPAAPDPAAPDPAADDPAISEAGVASLLRSAPADTTRLRDRLARDAEREGLVDVAYRSVDTPIGGLLLAASPAGLVYVAFEVEDSGVVLEMLADRVGPRILGAPSGSPVLDAAAAQIDQYLDGRRREFDLPLDTRLARGFRGEVQQHLARVGYGRTATYREIAVELDRPGAVRAVGSACATNPLPLVWPCHRILRSDGGLGGYRGGLAAKQRLLEMESAA
ncbi:MULTISPECIES: methylated-DNA--[protein]-cysteine S-methyltransferase [Dietzia]|jgi:methylated-DNA-[protein]-cysteine S-methyltransferase|uniref:Methylated-DNA--[protein]-cysteine S-methyltransferase n=1 Tax=Dietzia maris TaxID=37915 RepID=A0ABT8GY25_9ACTN|nr:MULTISPECIES: methylated-DNA--[protein]-cysteine S-methyltransferase [Dietzia]MCZ4541231.1 methylated-DNA--[protein]-cysteine S-methyltransferase [Dietzia maris]MCZ4657123.1 methylated-DNA--[protein]-cysteine S-methyltransferase [Dietzia kunjamensis]MDJ0423707.1 methylated-DNA--[protein]-cysteine S-methyltransferase [Dietzia kunjamensis]MDN4505107.1 methylated-DNA--[protein]-cysteine S-methyltransferase [Dietzia maris]